MERVIMPESKDFTSRHTASAYQVEDESEVVVTTNGRQTAYKGDWVVTEQRLGMTFDYIMSPDDFHGDWQEKDSDTPVDDALRSDDFATNPEDRDTENVAPAVTQVSPTDPAISADTQTNPAGAQNAGSVEGATPADAPAPAATGSAASETTATDTVNDEPQEVTSGPAENESGVPAAAEEKEATTTDPADAVSPESEAAQENTDSPSSANVADVMPPVGDNLETAGPTDVNSDAAATPDENATAAETPTMTATDTTNGRHGEAE
jgi:hypothetical protein